MDPLSSLYLRLHQQSRTTLGASPDSPFPDPPKLEDWLSYWDDNDTDLGNLRNFEHWLSRAAPASPSTNR